MRFCGDCTLCCTIMGVPEIGKPEKVQCRFAGAGCACYQTRPQECRDYSCWWLIEGAQRVQYLREEERPDKSGVLVSLQAPGSALRSVTGGDAFVLRGDLAGWPAQKMIKRLERKHLVLLADRMEFRGPSAALAAVRPFVGA